MIAQDENSLSLRIKAEAQRLGFELVGISPVKLPPHKSRSRWLRRASRRDGIYDADRGDAPRPPSAGAWAVSIISVGMNYRPFFPPDSDA